MRRCAGDAGVDGGVVEHLPDFPGRESVGARSAHVHGELVIAAERGKESERDRAAGAVFAGGRAADRPGPPRHRNLAARHHRLLRLVS